MMLRGEKPLACFSDEHGKFPDAVTRYFRMFDRHVVEGRLVKREYVTVSAQPPYKLHVLLYALPTEQWRIDAMIELRAQPRWSLDCERREGELLGYSDDEIRWWISQFSSTQDSLKC
jgi:hypothetical protein